MESLRGETEIAALRERVAHRDAEIEALKAKLAEVAWHAIQYQDEACTKPQCTGCLSDGDDACPLMPVVLTVECPFPDEP